jgi:hypothetical protein
MALVRVGVAAEASGAGGVLTSLVCTIGLELIWPFATRLVALLGLNLSSMLLPHRRLGAYTNRKSKQADAYQQLRTLWNPSNHQRISQANTQEKILKTSCRHIRWLAESPIMSEPSWWQLSSLCRREMPKPGRPAVPKTATAQT